MNKKYLIAAFAATAMVLSGASIAEDSGFMITPSIGMFDYEDDRINDPVRPAELDHDLFGSLGVGYRFNSPWALELVYKYGETETTTATPSDVDYQGIHVDGLYHFDNDSRITPYLAFGGGYAETEADDTSKTIDETNVDRYFSADGTPSSKVIVEGANSFITPAARHIYTPDAAQSG